jgi:hypothetical protein
MISSGVEHEETGEGVHEKYLALVEKLEKPRNLINWTYRQMKESSMSCPRCSASRQLIL